MIWDQVVLHGTNPNFSANCRYAQFLKAFSRRAVFQKKSSPHSGELEEIVEYIPRMYRRSKLVLQCLHDHGCQHLLTDLGRSMTGVDILSSVETE